MSLPHALVVRFFQLLQSRQFSEAERILERVKERVPKTEWNKGYYMALRGMMSALKSKRDTYVWLPKLDLNDEKALRDHRREFMAQSKNRLHADYDRGFFSAWADFMRVLIKTKGESKMYGKLHLDFEEVDEVIEG